MQKRERDHLSNAVHWMVNWKELQIVAKKKEKPFLSDNKWMWRYCTIKWNGRIGYDNSFVAIFHLIWMKSNTMIISVGIEHQFHPISSCSVCNWWMRWLGVMFDCPVDSKDTFIRLLNDLFSLCISNNVSSLIFFLHFYF